MNDHESIGLTLSLQKHPNALPTKLSGYIRIRPMVGDRWLTWRRFYFQAALTSTTVTACFETEDQCNDAFEGKTPTKSMLCSASLSVFWAFSGLGDGWFGSVGLGDSMIIQPS